MLLIKQVGVYLNFVHNRYKQFITDIFRKNNINLTPEQFLVIDMLWKQDSVSQQFLADTLMKDKNSITKLIDAMEKKDILIRIPDKCDRRQKMICLTPYGRSLENDVTSVAIDAANLTIKDIPEKDLETFIRVLNLISCNMDEYID